jgi:DNA-binding XRE family transcriptional regulator
MKRIIRDRHLTPEEAERYRSLRQQLDAERPEIVARHQQRMASLDQLESLFTQLKEAREAQGLSLAELAQRTGANPAALTKLETEQKADPTVETLVRYAEALGKRLVVSLADAS